jgi:hypothetical protein
MLGTECTSPMLKRCKAQLSTFDIAFQACASQWLVNRLRSLASLLIASSKFLSRAFCDTVILVGSYTVQSTIPVFGSSMSSLNCQTTELGITLTLRTRSASLGEVTSSRQVTVSASDCEMPSFQHLTAHRPDRR